MARAAHVEQRLRRGVTERGSPLPSLAVPHHPGGPPERVLVRACCASAFSFCVNDMRPISGSLPSVP